MSLYIPDSANTRYLKSQQYMENAQQINFHKFAITDVKERLGKSCTYLTHLSKKKVVQVEVENDNGEKESVDKTVNNIYFLAHLDIKGEKRAVRVDTGLEAKDLVAENYKALLTQLANYVTGKEDI